MSGYKAYKAMKRANASQSRLIEKQATRIKALEGVVEATQEWSLDYIAKLHAYLVSSGKTNAALWVSGIYRELAKLEEV